MEDVSMRDRVEEVLNRVRPMLAMDGGNIELVDVSEETGVVKVKLLGACGGCPMSQMTLKMGVERALRQSIPEVKEVVAV
jgi:Fe-S cluster biogenesis protein NfuA